MHFFVAKLLSIAVMIDTFVRHVQNLRPTNRLIYHAYTANKLQLPSFVASFRDNSLEYPRKTLYCQKLESLINICAADSVGLSWLVFT